MATIKKPEKEVSAVAVAERQVESASQPVQNSNVNIVDTLWDGWLNGLKTINAYQFEVENLTIQAIENQKDVWNKNMENLEKMEGEVKKFLDDIKVGINNNVKNMGGEQAFKTYEEWNQRVEEVTSRMQQLTWTPGKASINVFNKSQDQFESTIKNIIEQQQKTREEVSVLIDNLVSQVKSTQKGLVESFESNKNYTFSFFK